MIVQLTDVVLIALVKLKGSKFPLVLFSAKAREITASLANVLVPGGLLIFWKPCMKTVRVVQDRAN